MPSTHAGVEDEHNPCTAISHTTTTTTTACAARPTLCSAHPTPCALPFTADVANRWWHEVQQGSYVFDRQEAEVAQLRSLKPQELLGFARELLGGGGSCRKLTVEVRGEGEVRVGGMGNVGCRCGYTGCMVRCARGQGRTRGWYGVGATWSWMATRQRSRQFGAALGVPCPYGSIAHRMR